MQMTLEGIKKSFGTKNVLTDIQGTFEQGKIYGLLGRNGSGKTTLFNCLSGELISDGGSAVISENGACRALTDTDIGYVFATPILPEFLTGYEFLKFIMDINKTPVQDKSIDDYFDLVKIDVQDRNRLIKGYSHGMKNKLQMLCYIITKPPVLLLDEPLTSFDVVVALEMKKLLRDIKQDHVIIFSTHILQLAIDLCDEIVILHQGKLEAVDSSMIHSPEFEDRIFEILKDEEDSSEGGR